MCTLQLTIALKKALELIELQDEWIKAVPKDTQLPTMPGFDRDWFEDELYQIKQLLKDKK